MSKKYEIKEDVYIILLRYFQGNVIHLSDEKVKQLRKNIFNGKPIPEVDKEIIKVFKRILKIKKERPEIYAKWFGLTLNGMMKKKQKN